MTSKQAENTTVQPRMANTEESRDQMSTGLRASAAARDAEEAQEQRRRVAAQVQNEAAEQQGTELVYKKDAK